MILSYEKFDYRENEQGNVDHHNRWCANSYPHFNIFVYTKFCQSIVNSSSQNVCTCCDYNERTKFHVQPLREGAAISADNQARFLLTQLTLTHLDSSGNNPSKRYALNGETGYVAENLSVYHCVDADACKTAISLAVDDMMKDVESRTNILNPETTHVSTGMAVGNSKVVMVFDFEARRS
jgi:hypothetical protein